MAVDSTTQVPIRIESALKKAADATGVDFQYLIDTAKRESGFRPSVKASTSSASGLFQFIESTWLQMVKEKGPELGLGDVAQHITKTGRGKFEVADAGKRRQILELRNNPEVAALMAGAFTQLNAQSIESQIGRKPTSGELYIAHFLGAHNGGKLIKASSLQPEMKAADLFPQAARSNKSLFYRRDKPVSVKGLYQNLVRRHHVQSVDVASARKNVPENTASQEIAAINSAQALKPTVLQGAVTKNTVDGVQTARASAGQIFDQGMRGSFFSLNEIEGRVSDGPGFFQAQAKSLINGVGESDVTGREETKKAGLPIGRNKIRIANQVNAQRVVASVEARQAEAGGIGVWDGYSEQPGSARQALVRGAADPQQTEAETGAQGLFKKGGLGILKG